MMFGLFPWADPTLFSPGRPAWMAAGCLKCKAGLPWGGPGWCLGLRWGDAKAPGWWWAARRGLSRGVGPHAGPPGAAGGYFSGWAGAFTLVAPVPPSGDGGLLWRSC